MSFATISLLPSIQALVINQVSQAKDQLFLAKNLKELTVTSYHSQEVHQVVKDQREHMAISQVFQVNVQREHTATSRLSQEVRQIAIDQKRLLVTDQENQKVFK